jgi:hypothetical protein
MKTIAYIVPHGVVGQIQKGGAIGVTRLEHRDCLSGEEMRVVPEYDQ